jgi:PAS domain S-box-containing protein
MSDAMKSDFLSLADIFSYDQNFQDIMLNMLESALEASFQGVMITEAEPGFPIIYVNPAVCQMTGYERTELLGQSPRYWRTCGKSSSGAKFSTGRLITTGKTVRRS